MDIISHGLWGGVSVGRENRKKFWTAFAFGVSPDLFSFGIFFIERFVRNGFEFGHRGPPDILTIPSYVGTLYNFTHSLVIFTIVFLLVWYLLKSPVIPMLAWAFHIILDIFTHSSAFFPTPFLYPISNFTVDGATWGNPYIYIPNLTLLLIAYIWFYYSKRKRK